LNLLGGQEDRGRCAVGVGHDGRVGGRMRPLTEIGAKRSTNSERP
jgi:hypothetical protein